MITDISRKRRLLRAIAARASSPLERLQSASTGEQDSDEQDAQVHLQHLYSVVDATDGEQQKRLLAHFELEEQQMIQALSLSRSSQEEMEPSWIMLLEQILSQGVQDFPQEQVAHDRCLSPMAPVPFEELFLPFISYARQQLMTRIPDQSHLLSDAAQAQLEHWLLDMLFSLAGSPMGLEFMYFRALDDSSSNPSEEQSQQRVLYNRFVSQYAGEGLLDFFAQYSSLARLLIHYVELWIEVCAELLERLKADRDLITHTFFAEQFSALVVGIKAGCSDRHHHGRTVFLLTFADGHKLVYKPRCMDIDDAFFKCVSWFNENGLSPDLKSPGVLNRNTYGWMEYIEHVPCTTSIEVKSYYLRCGLLLCLFYVLGSTDMHHENLIAQGAYPVPIDLETIVSPSIVDLFSSDHRQEKEADSAEEKETKYSILRSGMLSLKIRSEGQDVDVAALGDNQAYDSLLPSPCWRNVNTDAMTLSYEIQRVNVLDDNKVVIDGHIVKSSEYIEDLVAGFRLMYHFLMEHRAEFLVYGKMLDLFADCPIRYVYRPTSVYAKQILRLTSLDFLQDGTRRWIDSQIFKKPLLKKQVDPRCWAIVSAELAALERLDVPWFGTSTDSAHLYVDEGIIVENVFMQSALQQTRSCLASLNDEDMEKQIKSIYKVYAPVPSKH